MQPTAHAGLADPETLTALRTCVHCGICLPQCPTYRVLGEEMDSPRGRLYLMRAVAEGRLEPTETYTHHLDLCLGCRACETACPAGVKFGALLETARADLGRRGRPASDRWLRRMLFALFPRPERLGPALGLARRYRGLGLQTLVRRSGILRRVPRLAALDALLERMPTEVSMPEYVPARGKARGRAGVLTGCVQRFLFSDVTRATIQLLSLAGWNVVVPRAQGCCGALELHAGRVGALRERAAALASAFPADVDWIVTDAAGCGSAMREYGHWLPGSPAARLGARVRDVTELLVDAELHLAPLPLTVTYHDACHLAHGQQVRSAPRELLRRIPGLTLVELGDSDLCCGSAGVYNVLQPDMADRLLDLKLARIAETGARVVAAGNPGCLMQIAKGARARGLELEVVHPVTLLARSAGVGAP
ncbi:MAG TPA: heterodisulfide reductase-related iron-sulfur binding cluster [Methylomirabilota bacterium]